MSLVKNTPPRDFNDVLVRLYGISQERPIAQFESTALALLKSVLTFDAAIWGAGSTTESGIDIHSFHLHNKTPEMVTAYEEVKHLDSASGGMLATPRATRAFHAAAFFSDPAKHSMRDFMEKFEQPNFLLSTDLDAQASLLNWLTLYRSKQDAHFKAADVQRLHVFAPHLKQALALNRAAHLGKVVASVAGKSGLAIAIADTKGFIHAHDAHFMTVLTHACGHEYAGSNRLPRGLAEKLAAGETLFNWQQLLFQCQIDHGLFIIKLRAEIPADSLTARERTIASLVSKGFTYKEVAVELGRSPATVRNQIQGIYAKLQVNNIAELVQALSGLR